MIIKVKLPQQQGHWNIQRDVSTAQVTEGAVFIYINIYKAQSTTKGEGCMETFCVCMDTSSMHIL